MKLSERIGQLCWGEIHEIKVTILLEWMDEAKKLENKLDEERERKINVRRRLRDISNQLREIAELALETE